jgi:hypothetical protein
MMANQYIHGIEFVSIDNGQRSIDTPRAGVVGVVGTAPAADVTRLPLNTPVLLNSTLRADIAAVGTSGTLGTVMDIFNRTGNIYAVFVRVAEGANANDTTANIVAGIQALKGAESVTAAKPRILIAPGYSADDAVALELNAVCDSLRAINFIDADPASEAAAAITYALSVSSKRANVCWPYVKIFNTSSKAYADVPMSIVAAALEANTNYWESSSNHVVPLVSATAKPVHFELSEPNTTANLLNENGVTTVIHQNGFRLWGSRNSSGGADALWRYRQHVRLDDMIAEAIIAAHLWAVDKNITTNYIDSVVEGVGSYLRYLASPGIEAIAGGKCWVDREVNTAETMGAGKILFDFDYGRFGIAETVSFRRYLNQSYVEEVVA